MAEFLERIAKLSPKRLALLAAISRQKTCSRRAARVAPEPGD